MATYQLADVICVLRPPPWKQSISCHTTINVLAVRYNQASVSAFNYCLINIFASLGIELGAQWKWIEGGKITVRYLFCTLDDIVDGRRIKTELWWIATICVHTEWGKPNSRKRIRISRWQWQHCSFSKVQWNGSLYFVHIICCRVGMADTMRTLIHITGCRVDMLNTLWCLLASNGEKLCIVRKTWWTIVLVVLSNDIFHIAWTSLISQGHLAGACLPWVSMRSESQQEFEATVLVVNSSLFLWFAESVVPGTSDSQ